MQLGGSAPNQYDLIRDGAIDGDWVILGYQPNRFPEAEAMELPFMTSKSGQDASAAAWITEIDAKGHDGAALVAAAQAAVAGNSAPAQ